MDEDDRAMEVIVPDDQLSLAIGKKGQNVRLASRLSGWKLDIRSESEADEEQRRTRASLIAIPGVGDVTAEYLLQEGFKSAEEVAESDIETLAEIEGIGPERAEAVLQAAKERVEALRKAEAEAAAAAAAEEAERVRGALKALEGVDDSAADKLVAAGLHSIEAVSQAGADKVGTVLGLGSEDAQRIATAARAVVAEAARQVADGEVEEGPEVAADSTGGNA